MFTSKAVKKTQRFVRLFSAKPSVKPASPEFSSGPCKKRPGWTADILEKAAIGRSHRSKIGKAKLQEAIEETRAILGIPADYKIGIVPASDTGAIEAAMWSMLGPKPVDVLHWESFGKGWLTDVAKQLKIKDVREITAGYGEIPDLKSVNKDHDVIFTFNGTTSGVRVPDLDWIADDRTGITFNDATSAVFAMDVDWSKADVTTYSWQKVLGGEGAHGMLILSPRAVERLETYTPDIPLPKIFRLTKGGKLIDGIFKGATINTPSMVCVEDYLDSLKWCGEVGGLKGLISRSEANLGVLEDWVSKTEWASFLAKDKKTRSNTSVCLSLDLEADKIKQLVSLLDKEDVAYDIGAYRDAPPGLRIWCGATVETEDVEKLTPWIEWAYNEVA
uniref:phosphoserine transaminase n=1 Tax=Lotharella globosa TaxID=91324 RepID=A0A6U3AP53_9EUKA|mmetsp:Transcript_20780/g.42006  ORF Transcript_20780/g.42006 Transcript_20780/m.42006 type:complete len:389 (+) Transcript_20780:73-1239(+)